jgi:hypothetical protein
LQGREVVNVAERAWRVRQTTKKTRHRTRVPVIPTDEQRSELFRLASADCPAFGALVVLSYYTAARPESESCRILHRDVSVPDRENVRAIDGAAQLGTVTYADPKCGRGRVVPLHPAAEAALQSIMDPEADPEAAVFPRGDGSPWDRHSYRVRWNRVRAALVERWPELAGMRLRDLRNAAETDTRNRGTDPAIAAKLAGHSERMSDHYATVTDAAARDAIMRLGAQVAV